MSRADLVTWKTRLFDPKIAQNSKYQYDGHNHGDAWKRNVLGFLVGQCPLVAEMLRWAEKQVMETITMDMYGEEEHKGTFGDLKGESSEVLAGHVWSFLQMCVSDAAATSDKLFLLSRTSRAMCDLTFLK